MNIYIISEECYESKWDLEPGDQLNVGEVFMNLEDAKRHCEFLLTEYDTELKVEQYDWAEWKDDTWEYAWFDERMSTFMFRITMKTVK